MKVGVYFDLRNPPQWRRDPVELYGSFLELCEEAESVGLDTIWVTEHHGFDDDYLPTPLTLLAAVAARTRRVRLGTAIVVSPLHAAAEIAEQAAVVDLLSGGRLDLGLGAGYRSPEFDLYAADMESRYRVNDARPAEIRKLWESGAVTPAPAQERVPIWMGYLGPKGARRAGRMGENLLSIDARNWPHYRQGLIEGGHDPALGVMGGAAQGWVSDDPERDWQMVGQHLAAQSDSYRRHARMGTDFPFPKPVDPDRLRERRPLTHSGIDYFVHGTAQDMADFVAEHTAGAPVETLYLWAGLPGMAPETVAQHIRRIGADLAPRLRAAERPLSRPDSRPRG
ncbi:LLM class flavin-dependent oxidoreductase [Rhodococcus koreensis]|uniref:LLM class flavin-dependent oxidoreductase n=1 Tax=Rhodococcus koreensis TaxID=99653 RepID=UPI0036DC425E